MITGGGGWGRVFGERMVVVKSLEMMQEKHTQVEYDTTKKEEVSHQSCTPSKGIPSGKELILPGEVSHQSQAFATDICLGM